LATDGPVMDEVADDPKATVSCDGNTFDMNHGDFPTRCVHLNQRM
jgi:hypothetical protein